MSSKVGKDKNGEEKNEEREELTFIVDIPQNTKCSYKQLQKSRMRSFTDNKKQSLANYCDLGDWIVLKSLVGGYNNVASSHHSLIVLL